MVNKAGMSKPDMKVREKNRSRSSSQPPAQSAVATKGTDGLARKPSVLFLTPNPDHPSFHGRWPYVLEGYRDALAGIDAEIFDQPWSEPVTGSYDLITPLVAWGYHNTPDEFRAALSRLPAPMLNPAEIVGWNVNKRYLKDLAEAGIRIIPTVFVDRITDEALAQARADFCLLYTSDAADE